MISINKFHRKVYKLDIPIHLIQSIRVYQALMELGLTLEVPSNYIPTFEYLRGYYPIKYKVDQKRSHKLDVNISHSKPYVTLGHYRQPLLFPQRMFEYCSSFWARERNTDFLFLGLVTPERQKVLHEWRRLINQKTSSKIIIKNSERGRQFPNKAWDEDYYKMMANARFVLCPNGDFVWTYRFFEATMCGAIPIVQEDCDLYKGFTYYRSNSSDELVWSEDIARENFNMTRKLIGPPDNMEAILNI